MRKKKLNRNTAGACVRETNSEEFKMMIDIIDDDGVEEGK